MTTDQKPWVPEMPDEFFASWEPEHDDGYQSGGYGEVCLAQAVRDMHYQFRVELAKRSAELDAARARIAELEAERDKAKADVLKQGLENLSRSREHSILSSQLLLQLGYAQEALNAADSVQSFDGYVEGCSVHVDGNRVRKLAAERDAALARIAELEDMMHCPDVPEESE